MTNERQNPIPNEKKIEKAVLVGVTLSSFRSQAPKKYTEPLSELAQLAETAGAQVVGKLTQGRQRMDSATHIGKGKTEELKAMVQELGADLVVFDEDLTPSQGKNLEEALEIRVIDRTELILDIFAAHARTYEAKLQVELAQLKYSLPRLKRLWEHLDRYRGGIGTKGPGEKQIESDRRIIKKKIGDLSDLLEKIQERKETEVKSRNEKCFTVGIVGYTNAGKSTLMNALTDADVLVEDKLFATLDTRTRVWALPQGRQALLSDTVGFIDKLPHHLVASFRATLEEAHQAQLLLHVVDVSHPDVEHQIHTVNEVLASMGLQDKPTLLVFNKLDLVKDRSDLSLLVSSYPSHIAISALNRENLDVLSEKALQALEAGMLDLRVSVSATQGKLIHWLESHGRMLEKQCREERMEYLVRVSPADALWIRQQPEILETASPEIGA